MSGSMGINAVSRALTSVQCSLLTASLNLISLAFFECNYSRANTSPYGCMQPTGSCIISYQIPGASIT